MKHLKIWGSALLIFAFMSSCSSIRVLSDYDQQANFKEYSSYAFYKTGIDKAQISDLDKKRILRAIDTEMSGRGFAKSENPDLLISIFTKEEERVDVYNNNFGWGWGGGAWGWGPAWAWGPGWGWGWGGGTGVSTSTQGSLYIDLIDTQTKELVWQGKGEGTLSNTKNIEKKEQRIKAFVSQILEQYPPTALAAQ